eukprot:scaffold5578_cov110-Isochrysis_galbana.AAC.1
MNRSSARPSVKKYVAEPDLSKKKRRRYQPTPKNKNVAKSGEALFGRVTPQLRAPPGARVSETAIVTRARSPPRACSPPGPQTSRPSVAPTPPP